MVVGWSDEDDELLDRLEVQAVGRRSGEVSGVEREPNEDVSIVVSVLSADGEEFGLVLGLGAQVCQRPPLPFGERWS